MNTPVTSGIDRIDLMQTFVRIVESGSLSAAAAQLSTSQPTVSRRLQSLERLLGAKLILRTTHAMKLTDDGQRCYEQAKLLLERWVSLEDQLSGAGDEPVGTLRVRAPHAFGQDQLIAPLTRYLQRYPNLSVDWMLNDRTPDFISEDIDCAIQVGECCESVDGGHFAGRGATYCGGDAGTAAAASGYPGQRTGKITLDFFQHVLPQRIYAKT